MGVIVLVAAILLFRWRVYKMRRRMEEQFGEETSALRASARPLQGSPARVAKAK